MSYFITPAPARIVQGLDAWQWLDMAGKRPWRVTAFGDVFLRADDGIWFLDTLEGKLQHVCRTEAELDRILSTDEGRDVYLFAGLVDHAVAHGLKLGATQCYDFKVEPVVGGTVEFENVQVVDFAAALNLRGQIHEQVKDTAAGTQNGKVEVDEPGKTGKPWWKLW